MNKVDVKIMTTKKQYLKKEKKRKRKKQFCDRAIAIEKEQTNEQYIKSRSHMRHEMNRIQSKCHDIGSYRLTKFI